MKAILIISLAINVTVGAAFAYTFACFVRACDNTTAITTALTAFLK